MKPTRERIRFRSVRTRQLHMRVSTTELDRWRNAAPNGNVSAWLRTLANHECNLPQSRRTDTTTGNGRNA